MCPGNNTWLSPGQDLWLANGFHNHAVHDLFDFVTHHPYPALQCLPEYSRDPLDDMAEDGPKWRFWRNACVSIKILPEFLWTENQDHRPEPAADWERLADAPRRRDRTSATAGPEANRAAA